MSDIFYADGNGDGYNELGQLDTNGDGVADSFTYDANADGYSETLAFDTNGDGAVDTVQVDTDLDGVVDRTDGTGAGLVIEGPPSYLSPAGGDGTDALMSGLPYATPLQEVMIYDIIQSRDIMVDNAIAMAMDDD